MRYPLEVWDFRHSIEVSHTVMAIHSRALKLTKLYKTVAVRQMFQNCRRFLFFFSL